MEMKLLTIVFEVLSCFDRVVSVYLSRSLINTLSQLHLASGTSGHSISSFVSVYFLFTFIFIRFIILTSALPVLAFQS